MTKRQTRLFFAGGTTVFSLVFIGMTIDSHRQFPTLTHEQALTVPVIEGKHVWHHKNCINCHTLLGEGAYYAPDLTKITVQRGDAYLRAFLKEPARYYSEERHRRVMPNLNLTDDEITHLIAFLGWVSQIDNQKWPPRPIIVSGTPQAVEIGGAQPQAASSDPVAQGGALFRRSPPGCFSCHSIQEGVTLVGPSLAGLGARAAKIISSADYQGTAKTPDDYIRESITHPNAYLVPGPTFSAGGQSVMPPFDQVLKPNEVDQLVAYLATFK